MNLTYSYLALMIAQITTGVNIVVAKALNGEVNLFLIIFCRYALASILLLLASNPLRFVKEVRLEHLKIPLIQALLSGVLFNILCYYGLSYSTATHAGLILSTSPAILALMALLLLKERVNGKTVFSILLMILAIVQLQVDNRDFFNFSGDQGAFGMLIILLSLVPESLISILARKQGSLANTFHHGVLVTGFSCLFFIPLAFPMDQGFEFSNKHVTLLILTGASGSLFFPLWFHGLKKVPASIASLFLGVVPVASAILSVIILEETVTGYDLLAMGTIIVAIFIGRPSPIPKVKLAMTPNPEV